MIDQMLGTAGSHLPRPRTAAKDTGITAFACSSAYIVLSDIPNARPIVALVVTILFGPH